MHRDVSFTILTDAFNSIELTVAKADKTYKMVLDRCDCSFNALPGLIATKAPAVNACCQQSRCRRANTLLPF